MEYKVHEQGIQEQMQHVLKEGPRRSNSAHCVLSYRQHESSIHLTFPCQNRNDQVVYFDLPSKKLRMQTMLSSMDLLNAAWIFG